MIGRQRRGSAIGVWLQSDRRLHMVHSKKRIYSLNFENGFWLVVPSNYVMWDSSTWLTHDRHYHDLHQIIDFDDTQTPVCNRVCNFVGTFSIMFSWKPLESYVGKLRFRICSVFASGCKHMFTVTDNQYKFSVDFHCMSVDLYCDRGLMLSKYGQIHLTKWYRSRGDCGWRRICGKCVVTIGEIGAKVCRISNIERRL